MYPGLRSLLILLDLGKNLGKNLVSCLGRYLGICRVRFLLRSCKISALFQNPGRYSAYQASNLTAIWCSRIWCHKMIDLCRTQRIHYAVAGLLSNFQRGVRTETPHSGPGRCQNSLSSPHKPINVLRVQIVAGQTV